MKPFTYIHIFAWIAIVALTCSIFTSYWIPMLVGALVITLLISAVNSSRR